MRKADRTLFVFGHTACTRLARQTAQKIIAFLPRLAGRRSRGRRSRGLNRKGAVTVFFAVAITPLMMLFGLLIDFAWIVQTKADLDVAADSAAMAGVHEAANIYANGYSLTGQTPSQSAIYFGDYAACQWWESQLGSSSASQAGCNGFGSGPVVSLGSTTNLVTPTFNVQQNGQTFTATVSYTANVKEVMPRLLAWAAGYARVANTAVASIEVQQYGTVDFMLDNTSSMMLPSDATNQGLLQSAIQTWLSVNTNGKWTNQVAIVTPANGLGAVTGTWAASNVAYWPGTSGNYFNPSTFATNTFCSFACHWNSASSGSNPTDYFGLTRNADGTPKIALRYDIVQSATITAIQSMETLEQVPGQLSVGVYTFGGQSYTSSSYLTTVFAEAPIDSASANGTYTKDSKGAKAAIAALATITPPVSGDNPETYFAYAMNYMAAAIANGGDGNTKATPNKSVILVTDGMEDESPQMTIGFNASATNYTEGPIYPSVCSTIKNKNITLYVLYTTYSSSSNVLPGANIYLQPYILGTSSPSLTGNLSSCASSANDFIVATSTSDIQAAMQKLITEAVGNTIRLSN